MKTINKVENDMEAVIREIIPKNMAQFGIVWNL